MSVRSRDNVHRELCHTLFDALERGDVEAVDHCYAPDMTMWCNFTNREQTREENLAALCLGALLLTLFLQVFTRFIVRDPLSWTEEAARYLYVYVVFLGSLAGTNNDCYGFIQNVRQMRPGWRADAGPVAVIGAGGVGGTGTDPLGAPVLSADALVLDIGAP